MKEPMMERREKKIGLSKVEEKKKVIEFYQSIHLHTCRVLTR